MAKQNEVVAPAVARAIKASKGARIDSEGHKALIRDIVGSSDPDSLADNVAAVSNLSALNQEAERYGLIKTERDLPAFWRAVQAAM